MPRNAAKKANKNTESLPNLKKFTTTAKKARRNIHNKNNKEKKTNNNNNNKRKQKKSKKADVRTDIGFGGGNNRLYQNNDDCDANSTTTTTAAAALTTTKIKPVIKLLNKIIISSQDLATTKTSSLNLNVATTTSGISEKADHKLLASNQNTILKYFKHHKIKENNNIATPLHIGGEEGTVDIQITQSDKNSNFNSSNNNSKNEESFCTENNIAITTETAAPSTSSLPATPAIEASTSSAAVASASRRLSTLYPIVIETHISVSQSLPGDLNKTAAATSTPLSTLPSSSSSTKSAATTKHSTSFNVACFNSATAISAETETSNTIATTDTTTSTTATDDILLKHQEQHQQDEQQQKLQNKTLSQQQQQYKRRKRRYFHQHEVKARLDSLRTRKTIVDNSNTNNTAQQQQQQPQEKGHKDNKEEGNQNVLEISNSEETDNKKQHCNESNSFEQDTKEGGGIFKKRGNPCSHFIVQNYK